MLMVSTIQVTPHGEEFWRGDEANERDEAITNSDA